MTKISLFNTSVPLTLKNCYLVYWPIASQ